MKYSKLIMMISLVVLIIASVLISQLKIESNMEDMLPKESLSLKASQDFENYFTGNDQIVVVVNSKNLLENADDFGNEARAFMDDLDLRLQNEAYIDSLLYKISAGDLDDFKWAYMDMATYEKVNKFMDNNDLEEIQQVLMGLNEETAIADINYISSDEGYTYMMLIKPNINPQDFVNARTTFYEGLYGHIDDLLQDYDTVEAGVTGGAFIQDLEGDSVAFDGFFSTIMITLILILIIVMLFFGGLKLPILSMYPLILGAMIAAAMAFLIYGSLNMFSISFTLLLVGLGIDFAVHIMARYQEERRAGKPLYEAINISRKSTGGSIIMGAGTTAFAFGTFAIAQFKAFEQMGIISAIGIVSLCIMMLLIVPAMLTLFDKNSKTRASRIGFLWLEKVTEKSIKRPFIVIGALALVMIGVFWNVSHTNIQSDLTAVYPEEIPSTKWTALLKEAFDYDTNTLSFYGDNYDELLVMVEALEERDDISSVESISTFMPVNQEEKLASILKLDTFLKGYGLDLFSDMNLRIMTYNDLPDNIKENFVGKEGKLRGEIVPAVNIYDEKAYNTLIEGIVEITGKHPVGLPTIMNEVTVLVKEDMTLISCLCLIVVFIIGWIAFRKIKVAILTTLTVALTLYITLGILPIFNVEINIFSIAAFPLIIGIGIDASIHLVHRLKESREMTVAACVRETGKPILLTALTTIIGFGSLANINHPGMSNLGLVVSIGIGISLILTLFLVPVGTVLLKIRTK